MKPFEQLGYGMMKAILEAEASAVPAAAPRKKRPRAAPRQLTLVDDAAAERAEVNRIDAELARRRQERAKRRDVPPAEPHEPTEEEERAVRASQIDPADRDQSERDELIDSTFLEA